MRKFLSFTTALVSFVAFGSASSFAADIKSDITKVDLAQDGSVIIEKESASVNHGQAQKKSAHHRAASKTQKHDGQKHAQHTAAGKQAHKPAPVINAATEGPSCPKKMDGQHGRVDDGRPRVFLGGVIDAFYHYAAPEDGYKIGSAFNNIGVSGANTGTPGTINLNQALPAGAVGTNYYVFDEPTPANYKDYSRNWGAEANAALQFKIQGQNKNTGILYGAVADVSLNGVGSITGGPSPFHTNGTYLFASSSYGTLSMGYQEGPETIMRMDASNISVGDMGLGSDWYKFANLEGRDGTVPFLLASGLYTESFLAGTNTMGQFVDRLDVLSGKDHVDSSMPFRFSYQSPLTAGFKFGVSYAPRYNSKGFTGDYNEGFAQIGAPTHFASPSSDSNDIDSSIAPYYKNIVSGGISYQYAMSGIDLGISAVGEMATAVKHDDDLAKGNLYELFVEGKDLRSFGIGAKVGYAGLDFVASFATLGKSGVISDVYQYTGTAGANNAQMSVTDCANVGNKGIAPFCGLYKTDESSYYFTLGAGYKYQDAYLSATFFRSKAYDKNELRHFALGAQYNLAYGRTVFAPYISWNYFWTEQSDALSIADKYPGAASNTNSVLNGFQPHQDDNKGSVLIAGVRFLFS